MSDIAIKPLDGSPSDRAQLSDILIEAVASGASVTFLHPLAREAAEAFWEEQLAAAARGKRVVLGAFELGALDDAQLVGTVTLGLDCPPNQQHRGEIAKLMTRVSHRGRGVAKALMRAAEEMALARGRTLLVLDTATDGGAAALYEALGYRLCGEIPGYAFKPHGGLTGALFYWKQLA
jgi:ribosomal protein S18 acetylase RimI-like enzyme